MPPHINTSETETLTAWAADTLAEHEDAFIAMKAIARRLGGHVVHQAERTFATFGFWLPQLTGREVFLELYLPEDDIDLTTHASQRIRARRLRLPMAWAGEFAWVVVEGLPAGTRDKLGALYRVAYQSDNRSWHTRIDPMALSLPFGVFGPAELYDWHSLDSTRADAAHFASLDAQPDPDGVPRIQQPTNILQIHVGAATEAGTFAGLARLYAGIAEKLRAEEDLTPAEMNWLAYDSVQLMPVEPTIEYEGREGQFFHVRDEDDRDAEEVTVDLAKPDMFNWGYDIVIAGMSAANPVYCETGRPDELADLIATLHNFPTGPIKVIFDVVFGHADNQGLKALNDEWFTGPNMYGQDMNFRHPVVRAMMLEMQRRKTNFGADGLRVDGAQDFKYWDAETETLHHDDDYLHEMSAVTQEVAGQAYRPWMIFEDGRPWPRDDWELASTYRAVTEQQPDVFQWGPLTFAHNTPFLFTFWIGKWWRLEEVRYYGSRWITGWANHDTMRRGTQVDPKARVNSYLGDTLPEIYRHGYDNPTTNMLNYACLPGVPMDMINALMRAPWSFMRNTDDRYAVKVASEEARFLDWAVDEADYARDEVFPRLKELGFSRLDDLHRYWHALDHAVQITDYDLEAMVSIMRAVKPPLAGPGITVGSLKEVALAWMSDVYELCNVTLYEHRLDPAHVAFNKKIREFRLARRWLGDDLREGETFDRILPVEGAVIFYGLRKSPDDGEELLFIMNAEGAPRTLTPINLPIPGMSPGGWEVALAPPGMAATPIDKPLTLHDSEGVVYRRGR
jgi:hypothetical protein